MIRMFLLMFGACLFLVYAGLYGIDREMARQDYLKGNWAEHCIFQSNCDHYNNMEVKGNEDDTTNF